jgi:hypothetical protein
MTLTTTVTNIVLRSYWRKQIAIGCVFPGHIVLSSPHLGVTVAAIFMTIKAEIR